MKGRMLRDCVTEFSNLCVNWKYRKFSRDRRDEKGESLTDARFQMGLAASSKET